MNVIKKIPIIFFLYTLTSCAPVYFESDFHGKVVDLDTQQPIPKAVVLAEWYNTVCLWGAGGEVCNSSYNDAYVTLTNEKGYFDIPGKGLRLFSTLEKMTFLVYKSSYTRHGLSTERKNALDGYKVDSSGRTIFSLKKLSLQEFKNRRMLSPGTPPNEAPFETVEPYLNEYNKEMIWRGYTPIKTWKGQSLIIPEPERHEVIVETTLPKFTGPCKLRYTVYQENGEWKIGLYPGRSLSDPIRDNRPECIKKEKEMEKLYNEHIRK